MKKLVLSFLFVCLSLYVVNAQRIGIIGGVNFGKFDVEGDADTKFRTGFQAGATIDFKIPLVGFHVGTGLLFSQQSFTMQYANEADPTMGYTRHLTTNSLKLPVHLRKELNLPLINPYIELGPYLAYSLSAKGKDIDGSESLSFNEDSDRLDFGLDFAVGCVALKNYQVTVGYNLGLLSQELEYNGKFKTRYIYCTVGYLF